MICVGFDRSGLDPNFKSHAHRGIGRYVLELHRYLARVSEPGLEIGWFDHSTVLRSIPGADLAARIPYGRTTLCQQVLYPFGLHSKAMQRFSFLHFPAHMDAPARTSKPFVLTVLDLIPLLFADRYSAHRAGWRFKLARWLELQSIQRATLLLAISENTARDVERLLGISRERIVVTPLGVDECFFRASELRAKRSAAESEKFRRRLGIPVGREILLYVGGHDERKNIPGLVAIAGDVVHQMRTQDLEPPLLVLAGRIHSELERRQFEETLSSYSMREDTVNLGYVSDEDLLMLYAESALFLFPSLYEGFGLPVLEAMAAGLPVVSSRSSAMPEVIGDSGLLFDPLKVSEGAEAVLEVLRNRDLARRLSFLGAQRARSFTWEQTGRTTLEGYRRAAEILSRNRECRPKTRIDSEKTARELYLRGGANV